MRQIVIEWLELSKKVTVTLDETRNAALAGLLWENLPYCSIQTHALVSGQHLYHIAPITELVHEQAKTREDRTLSPDGTVFLSQLHHLAVKYGDLTEYLTAAAVGNVIPEHLPILREIGGQCWDSTYQNGDPIRVSVYRKGEKAVESLPLGTKTIRDPEAQALLRDVYEETSRIWLTPPKEILDLHNGRIRSRAGSYDQYFNTLVFLNGETRPLGYCVFGGLIRTCKTTDISLPALVQVTKNLIKTPAEFLGYCGLDALWRFTQRTLQVLDKLETKEEYYNLLASLCLYAERLNTWNLHYFPWRLGESMLLPKGASARA